MKYVQEYAKDIESAASLEDLLEITREISEGKLQYAYPYQLKLFVIEYAKLVLRFIDDRKNE